MVGFLRRFFGAKAELPAREPPLPSPGRAPRPSVRRLAHPRELQVNDIFRFHETVRGPLGGKRFQVTKVSTLVFEAPSPTFALRGEDEQRYFLVLSDDQSEEYLTIIKPIKRLDVGRMFRLEEFAGIFEEKEGLFSLERQEEPQYLTGWTAPRYHLSIDALSGFFYQDDLRGRDDLPENGGEGLDYYMLLDDEEERTLEVEVYDGGDTEVALGLRMPLRAIAELWPSS